MAWLFVAVLVIVWFMGLVTSHTLGGFIHVLLVVAMLTVLIRVLRGPAEEPHIRGNGTQAAWRKP